MKYVDGPDSAFQRSTTSLNRAAASPPHTDDGTLLMRPMKACSIARISSLRVSVVPATARIRSKSVDSVSAPVGVLTQSPSMLIPSTTTRDPVRFHLISRNFI